MAGAGTAALAQPPGPASASDESDRASARQLGNEITAEGAQVQRLASRYDALEGRLAAIERGRARDATVLDAQRRARIAAELQLRHVAIDAYVTAESGSASALTTITDATSYPEVQVYLGVADGSLGSATTELEVDRHLTTIAARMLASARASTAAAIAKVERARGVADGALAADRSFLRHVNSNLPALVTACNYQRGEAAAQASERAIAATTQREAVASASAGPPPAAQPTPGTYANLLRAIGALTPEHIDQGVDYSGSGPIYAVGDGVVLRTVNRGWPGGTYIAYLLTDGPAAGLVVYAAEDIEPDLQVGESVTAGTVIGQVYEGPDGIETGWSNPAGDGSTMAAQYGQFKQLAISVSTAQRLPLHASSMNTWRASCAPRLGRNPKLQGRKSGSSGMNVGYLRVLSR